MVRLIHLCTVLTVLTVSEKGIFELKMTFPADYPMKPPELVFVSEFYHPNGFGFVFC